MPSFCVVVNCNDKYGHAENISFHKFPFKRKELLQKWLEFAERGKDWQPSKWSAVCSRHFRDEDFNCVNERKTLKKTAVPTQRVKLSEAAPMSDNKETKKAHVKDCKRKSVKGSELKSAIVEKHKSINSTDGERPPATALQHSCRLCGGICTSLVTFSTNFEIYGMIQKCLPMLNIQQDDNLPKELCQQCVKQLESYSAFIDRVLETQSALQRTFRNHEPRNQKSVASEKLLKIKQEPLVRVKQEVAESGYSDLLADDMDMGMDDMGCEQETHDTAEDQKFQFCDFPMLNSQDIINNCDIMEIINLDDPFINIPDDDGTTCCTDDAHLSHTSHLMPPPPPPLLPAPPALPSTATQLPSAHELLQAHLLIEEHNYAYAAEDFKEEWQIKNCYKTEKLDGYEQSTNDELAADDGNCSDECNGNSQNSASIPTLTSSLPASTATVLQQHQQQAELTEERSVKPIVTSVSDLAETRFLEHTIKAKGTPTKTKPNIVVLNESIVQSASAFQLYNCNSCQSKFFSVDSLKQHHATTHHHAHEENYHGNVNQAQTTQRNNSTDNQQQQQQQQDNGMPMVCVPSANITEPMPAAHEQATESLARELQQQLYTWQQQRQSNMLQHAQHHDDINLPNLPLNCTRQLIQNYETSQHEYQTTTLPTVSIHSQYSNISTAIPTPAPKVSTKRSYRGWRRQLRSTCQPNFSLPKVLATYRQLCAHYRRLQLKFKQLQQCASIQPKSTSATNSAATERTHTYSLTRRHCCRFCGLRFAHIVQLLQHKQITPAHYVRKPSSFFAACYGCEKPFRSRRALRNHMRYICQTLPLRWFKSQMQRFRCRYCNNIIFTHWRVYRRHELNCQRKRTMQSAKLRNGRRRQMQHCNCNSCQHQQQQHRKQKYPRICKRQQRKMSICQCYHRALKPVRNSHQRNKSNCNQHRNMHKRHRAFTKSL